MFGEACGLVRDHLLRGGTRAGVAGDVRQLLVRGGWLVGGGGGHTGPAN
jgi:hypothetical protein